MAAFVWNESRHCYMRRKQAEKAIELCAYGWIEFGVTIRKLTFAEAIQARNKQAQTTEKLGWAELPDCIFQPPEYAAASTRLEQQLAFQANRFAEQAMREKQ